MDGLDVVEGGGMYHFKESGLDYVWLSNGFESEITATGSFITIHDIEGLHSAIARWIVKSPDNLRGQEVRFLRSMLGLSQDGLGKLLRQSRGSVARWESALRKDIPPGADSMLRIVYTKKSDGDADIGKLVELLMEIDEMKHSAVRRAKFCDDASGWKAAA